MRKKLTPWFPARVKPGRIGVYEKNVDRPGIFQHWNGQFWGGWAMSVKSATGSKHLYSIDQESSWRGLAEKPE